MYYLFNKNIEPSCSYCKFGKLSSDSNKILCNKKGIVELSDSCKKFKYEPLKRIPTKQKLLPKYKKSDFEI